MRKLFIAAIAGIVTFVPMGAEAVTTYPSTITFHYDVVTGDSSGRVRSAHKPCTVGREVNVMHKDTPKEIPFPIGNTVTGSDGTWTVNIGTPPLAGQTWAVAARQKAKGICLREASRKLTTH